MSTTPYEPSFPPSRQDYRELIDHHYLIRGLTFAPLILLPIAIKTSAQYGPLSMWTGIGMNLSILLTCLQFLILRPCLRHPHPPTRSQWFTGGTSYNNHFVMRFDDGTQHTFTIATSEQDISQLLGIIHPLYEGCGLHPDQTPLTIDMYVHSKTLVDARLD